MTDLFADFVPDAMIAEIFTVMASAPWHTFQVLTKRPSRMRAWISDQRFWAGLASMAMSQRQTPPTWPLPNVWLGTSCEDQATADARVPELLATPAAVRFVSAEPLLGPIDFFEIVPDPLAYSFRSGFDHKLDWIIVGGESGPGARPMHPAWARSIRDQCAAVGADFFFKQWGGWQPREWCHDGGTHAMRASAPASFQKIQSHPDSCERVGAGEDWGAFAQAGKKLAGRLLDGVTHDAMPEVRHG